MILFLLLALSFPAFGVDQQQDATSTSQSTNQGVTQNIISRSPDAVTYKGGYDINNVPQMTAPSLTTTLQDTCMGSSSGGVSLMGFGVSGGSTWKDEECIRRLNAKAVAEVLGDREAAKEIMCGNQEVFAAFVTLGRPCRMPPSYTVMVPGGALASYREPVPPGKYGVHKGKIILGPRGEPDDEVTTTRILEEGAVELHLDHTGKDL